MSEAFKLSDVFMSEFSASRGASVADSRPVARVTVSISEVEFLTDVLAQVGTKIEVSVRGADEEKAYCEILSEYVAHINAGQSDHDSDEVLGALSDFAMEATFARHRERILEATMRMGIPLFRLPLTLQEVEEKAASEQVAKSDASEPG